MDNLCPEAANCATFVYSSFKDEYKGLALKIKNLTNEAIAIRARVRKLLGKDVFGKNSNDTGILKRAELHYSTSVQLINTVPDVVKNCK